MHGGGELRDAESYRGAFSPVIIIGTPPPPHPQASVPSVGTRGRGTLACGRRGGGCLNSNEGTYTVALWIYMYFVVC